MNNKVPSPREIERRFPPTLKDVIGCRDLKKVLINHLHNEGRGTNVLVSGGTGTGKTATIKAYVRTLNCPHAAGQPPAPCGTCEDCKHFDVRVPQDGLFAILSKRVMCEGKEPFNYCPVDCAAVSESQIKDILLNVMQSAGNYVIFLDEVHRIVGRKMDHLLLKPLEELDAVWIASSARNDGLDPMFLRRFAARVSTSPPTEEELATFLADRCREWQIVPDDPATVALLARRSKQVTAECISVLALAASRDGRLLDKSLVQYFPFGCLAVP